METETLQLPSQVVSLGFLDVNNPIHRHEKPYYSNVPFTASPDARPSNVIHTLARVTVANLRHHEHHFQLDKHGFELKTHATKFTAWKDGKRVVTEYYPEMEAYLKDVTGAQKVLIYDHTLRRGTTQQDEACRPGHEGNAQDNTIAEPSTAAHVDLTLWSAMQQLRDDFGGEAADNLQGRIRVINIWRPLTEPLQTQPLAVCDYRSAKDDLVATDLIFAHMTSEVYLARHSDAQRWYYIDQQRTDEVWLLKMMDTEAGPNSQLACGESAQMAEVP